MAKGSKRNSWLKVGMQETRKVNKKMWNNKVRNTYGSMNGCSYKKLAKSTVCDKVT